MHLVRRTKLSHTFRRSALLAGVIGALLAVADVTLGDSDPAGPGQESQPPKADDLLIAVAPPPFSEDIFPCSDCHDPADEVDTTTREITFHTEITFEHDAENRWCFDCHDAHNRDVLHLADGRAVPFTESYRLCGQCHAQQLKNWRAGDHGRRTGYWNGQKEYLLCASCHNPHSPKFKAIEPSPPPLRQEEIR